MHATLWSVWKLIVFSIRKCLDKSYPEFYGDQSLFQQLQWKNLQNFRYPWRKFLKKFDICCWWVFLQALLTKSCWPVHQNKQQLSRIFCFSKDFWGSSGFFIKVVETKIDQNKPNDNSFIIKNDIERSPSYPNDQLYI